MTPIEAKVRELIQKKFWNGIDLTDSAYKRVVDQATTSILALIEGEVMAERERCAEIAGEYYRGDACMDCNASGKIYEAIRSSGEGK